MSQNPRFGTSKASVCSYSSHMKQKDVETAISNTVAKWFLLITFAVIIGAVVLPKIIVAMVPH